MMSQLISLGPKYGKIDGSRHFLRLQTGPDRTQQMCENGRVAVRNFSSKMATQPYEKAYSFMGINPQASHRERDEQTAQGCRHRLHHPTRSVWRRGVRR